MENRAIGKTRWAIAEGYIPDRSTGPEPEMASHETVCLLNASDEDARVEITIFFSDRDPAGPCSRRWPSRNSRTTRNAPWNRRNQRLSMSESANSEVVVITGATAGVGRATTRAFARRGARIGLLARGQDRLEATKQEVQSLGGEAVAIPTDVAEADQVEEAAATVENTFGPIDVWVNNAMTSVFAEFLDVEPDEYRRVTDVVYHGTVYGTWSALKRMVPRDRGSIVLVGSALAYRGIPLQSAYCGAKHAIEGMFDSVRAELLHNDSNVEVTMVQLPAVNTPQFEWVRSKLPRKAQPVPPIFQPEVAANAIVWSAHHNEREIYVGYPVTKAILGEKLVPGFADWYLAQTGYEGQMQEDLEETDRPDNLWDPVPGDRGAHGAFDDRARTWSPELWLSKNKRWLAAAGAGLAGFLGAFLATRDST